MSGASHETAARSGGAGCHSRSARSKALTSVISLRLTAVDGAEFGHVGAQAGGVGGAEARDGADDRGPSRQLRVGGDAGLQGRVGFTDQLVEQLDQRVAQLGGGAGVQLGV